MRVSATWSFDGRFLRIQFGVFGWQLKIILRKRAVLSQSSLGGDLVQNSAGFLVRVDRRRRTNSVPTVVVPQPE